MYQKNQQNIEGIHLSTMPNIIIVIIITIHKNVTTRYLVDHRYLNIAKILIPPR